MDGHVKDELLEKAVTCLSVDPVMEKILSQVTPRLAKHEHDLYKALLRAITGQQLSVKAASTIWMRFVAHFPNEYPSAEAVLGASNDELRSLGLSNQKAGYVKNIAQFHLDGKLSNELISYMNDEAVIDHLTQIKGVGKWTAEMLLMFSLGRNDVFPIDDLGIRQGINRAYSLPIDHKKHYPEILKLANNWSPYRSVASFALWDWKDNKK